SGDTARADRLDDPLGGGASPPDGVVEGGVVHAPGVGHLVGVGVRVEAAVQVHAVLELGGDPTQGMEVRAVHRQDHVVGLEVSGGGDLAADAVDLQAGAAAGGADLGIGDRKSTRLNSSHVK